MSAQAFMNPVSIVVQDGTGVLKPFNDLVGMIMTFSESLTGISFLLTGLCYILGVLFVLRGIFKLRIMADHRSQMFQPMEVGGPLVSIFVGAGLIWWPTLMDTVTYTFWGATSPLDYRPAFGSDFDQVWEVILKVMQIVGLIAFIRGWSYLTKVGEQGAQGMLTKGLTHIIGGVLAYHMGAVIHVVMTTFGFDWV